jgi:putative addiction module component (TIGR02574 family)
MKLSDLPEVQALAPEEKLQLVEELWQEIAGDLERLGVTPLEKEILDQRWAAFLRDPSSALDLDQFKRRVGEMRR